jgi:peptidoglycan/LPS O-acetylase OafA/YrhL
MLALIIIVNAIGLMSGVFHLMNVPGAIIAYGLAVLAQLALLLYVWLFVRKTGAGPRYLHVPLLIRLAPVIVIVLGMAGFFLTGYLMQLSPGRGAVPPLLLFVPLIIVGVVLLRLYNERFSS